MSYTKVLISLSCLSSVPAFAVTDQINYAKNFLNSSQEIRDIQTKITELGADENGNFSEQKFFNNIKNEPSFNALATSRDIPLKVGTKHPLIKDYQAANGLTETGVMNKETIDYVNGQQDLFGLNVTHNLDPNTWFVSYAQPLGWQVKTVQKSLAEWESVLEKQKLEKATKFIVVNIPNMRLSAYSWNAETGVATEDLVSRVVVGNRIHQTPIKDMKVWGMKYNPTWTPTNNIMKRTLFKEGELNLKWLESHKIRVFDKDNGEISYDDLTEDNFKQMRFVQPAGNDNALGLIKFETTSPDNIYLHDTNEKKLFGHNNRSYSSGCIRVDEYMSLSLWLSERPQTYIDTMLNTGETRTLNIPQKVPVYITYSQTYFDDEVPAFAPDVYRKNKGITYK